MSSKGRFASSGDAAEGREYVLRVVGPGATFNDVAVFDGGPNSDGAVAVGPTTVGFISKANVRRSSTAIPR